MPNGETLQRMYGTDYESAFEATVGGEDPKEPERAARFLDRLPRGTFIDYGCGPGALLDLVQARGWNAAGVELNRDVAVRTQSRTGARVGTSVDELLGESIRADVLHLGDVIEHLTDLDHQLPDILRLLKPGGTLLVQGPLEANANLFFFAIRAARRRKRTTTPMQMAPYHVLLATASGQRTLFARQGLAEIEFSIEEVDWPAPSQLTAKNWKDPRAIGLFMLRKLSRFASANFSKLSGNRFFYAGTTPLHSR